MFFDDYQDDPHSGPPKPPLWWRVRDWFDARIGSLLGGQHVDELTDDIDGYSDEDDVVLARQVKAPFFWRIRGLFDFIVGGSGELLSDLMEGVEKLFYGAVGLLLFAITPWNWFKKEPSASDDLPGIDDIVNADEEVSKARQRLDAVRYWMFGAPLDFLFEIGGRIGDLAERYMPRRIFWPFYWLLDALGEVYEFSADWWFSRNFRQLLWSLPAIALGGSLAASTLLGYLQPETAKIRRYETLMASAAQSKNVDQKVFARRKLEQLGFKQIEATDYQRALELAKAEEYHAAFEIMRELAPTNSDGPGFLPAHIWIAGSLLDGVIQPEDDLVEEVSAHVNHVLSAEPEDRIARRFRVELQVRQGKMSDELLSEMAELAEEQSDLYAALAHELRKRGDIRGATKAARAAIREHKKRAQQLKSAKLSPAERLASSLTPLGHLRIAESYMLVGDRQAERELLLEGLKAFPDSSELRDVVHAHNVDTFAKIDLRDTQALDLASEICEQQPKNPRVIERLMRGLLAKEDATLSQSRREAVEKATWKIVRHLNDEELLPSEVVVYAGDFYLVNNRPEEAVRFYTEACKIDPKASFAWNNLASIRSTFEPYSLEYALKAANKAIALNPDPRFYDTRGQIFVKLKRWKEAIRDLETAISGSIPNADEAHRSLVVAYRALGQTDLAQAHQKKLQTVESRIR